MIEATKPTYEDLEKKVIELEAIIRELEHEKKDLFWFKIEHSKVDVLKSEVYSLKKAIKALVE